jgi:shikimate kinase
VNLYLVGYRCCGKSSLGQLLAEHLGWKFVDTDRQVADQTGQTIAAMVAQEGWVYFRQREHEVLSSVASGQRQVVATGGGIVLDPQNVQCMQSTGFIVWLTASPDTIQQRMAADVHTAHQRPALTDRRTSSEIDAVLQQRTPLYRAAGNLELNTDHDPIHELVEQLLSRLRLLDIIDETSGST